MECSTCYRARVKEEKPATAGACMNCGPTESKYFWRGLCLKCYHNLRSASARKENPERFKLVQKRYRDRHKEGRYKACISWRKRNMDKWRAIESRVRAKRLADPKYRLCKRVGQLLRNSLGSAKAGRSWADLVDFTYEQLCDHLRAQFTEGMTWDLLISGAIQIDHIRPVASFNYTSPDDPQFKECWALSNLRPMWAPENSSKSSWHAGKRWTYKDHLLSPGPTDQARLEQLSLPCTKCAPALGLL